MQTQTHIKITFLYLLPLPVPPHYCPVIDQALSICPPMTSLAPVQSDKDKITRHLGGKEDRQTDRERREIEEMFIPAETGLCWKDE